MTLSRETTNEGHPPADSNSPSESASPETPDLERLFKENFNFVRRAVAKSLGPADADLDDLIQEVFLVAMRKLHTFDGQCQITTWLWGITWRVVSQHRQRCKLKQFFFPPGAAPPAISVGHPERDFVARQALRDVYAILDRMAEKKRQVFIMYELEEYSGPEIADILGCNQATVWTRLHYARKEFKERILKTGHPPQWSESTIQVMGRNGE